MSGPSNGGIAGTGLTEYRDAVGPLRYAAARQATKTMKKALLSVCPQIPIEWFDKHIN